MKQLFILFFSSLLVLTGCASREPRIVKIPDTLEPVMSAPPGTRSPGSLWPGEREGLYADVKARRVGDIVTITIKEEARASKEASTQSGRDTSMSAGIPALFGLEKSIMAKNQKVDMTTLLDATFSNQFKGSGKTMRKEDLVATLTTQVIKVYPNGTMKIRGGKSIIVNNEEQIIYLTGIVRPEDITADNTIDSSHILNARIAYTGKGALSDKQKPGWLMRIVDNVWPF
ncbi:flagellar basal body L-ring protein FlgH [Desulfolithobacter sp.]